MSTQYRSFSHVRRFAPLPDDVVVGLANRYHRDRFHALEPRLQELDPAGWEAFVDSPAIIAASWKTAADAIQARILALETIPAERCSCGTADAAGVGAGGSCAVCRAETQTTEIPF